MDRRLAEYLPPVVRTVRELKAITDGQQAAFFALWDAARDVLNDQFVDDATENGIRRWERILKITPKGSESLDIRRFRIKARLTEQLPFTLRFLNQQLTLLCGENGVSVEMARGGYLLRVRVALTSQDKLGVIESLVSGMKPAAIALDLQLMFNPHMVLARFTHRQLAKYTHKQLREERFRFNRQRDLTVYTHAAVGGNRHFQLMMEEMEQ